MRNKQKHAKTTSPYSTTGVLLLHRQTCEKWRPAFPTGQHDFANILVYDPGSGIALLSSVGTGTIIHLPTSKSRQVLLMINLNRFHSPICQC